ncbi:MAG: NADPH-dependent reductase [Clostridia bacterium]|jgi:multimeric flavodoxin WrbA|nr:NADPH-dependent reductase [Clostridia bacterium]
MKKIIAFVGSPRKKGNTSDVVNQVLKGAIDQGAEAKIYYLNDMNIRGCQNCLYCRKNEGCPIKDDMVEVYEEIKTADAVVIGSPIFIHQVSAQTKLLLDRLYPLTDSGHKPRYGRKKLLFVYSQAAPLAVFFRRYYRYMRNALKAMGLIYAGDIIATGSIEPGCAANQKKLMHKAYKAGQALAR